MAPEQLEGKEADERTDIFAFGAVLYEMVTGNKAFHGKSQASLITSIMGSEPAPISAAQSLAPAALDHVIRRCLAKEPEERWQAASDVMRELNWIAREGSRAEVVTPTRRMACRRPHGRRGGVGSDRRRSGRFSEASFRQLAPGGSVPWPGQSCFVTGRDTARLPRRRLVVVRSFTLRALDRFDPRPMPATEGALTPFFSPDGEWVGFITWPEGKLKESVPTRRPVVDAR